MEIFKLFGSIFVDSSAAQDSISKTSGKAETLGTKLSKGIKTAAKWATAVVAAAGAVGGAMLGAANKVAKTADEIDKASRRAGTTAENYQKLKYAMGQSGISAEKFEKTMIRNQKAVNEAAEGNKAYADTYKALGVSIEDASGNMRSADDIYNETLRKLADMEDINQRNALANQLFGKSYADLAPILDSGSQGIDDLTKRAEKLGLVMSQETVDAGVKFGDTLDDVKQMGGAVFNMIGAELLPILQVFLDWIIAAAPQIQETVHGIVEFAREVISGFQEFWKEHGETIKAITSAVFKTIGAIIQAAFEVIGGVIKAFCSLLEGDWKVFWDGIVQVAKGAGTLLYKAGKAIFGSLFDGIKSVWKSISDWVDGKVKWLADKLTFWKKSSSEMNGGKSNDKPNPNGRHAAGLPFVPYDGYVAELHRGETVLNASDTRSIITSIINELDKDKPEPKAGGDIIIPVYIGNEKIDEIIVSAKQRMTNRSGGFANV